MALAIVALDLSMGMTMLDLFEPARTCALEAAEYLAGHPAHGLRAITGFSEQARTLTAGELRAVKADMTLGSNLEDAMARSREFLLGETGWVLVFSRFEITCHNASTGPFFSFPPVPGTVRSTVEEVRRSAAAGLTVHGVRFHQPGWTDVPVGSDEIVAALVGAGGAVIQVSTGSASAATRGHLEAVP